MAGSFCAGAIGNLQRYFAYRRYYYWFSVIGNSQAFSSLQKNSNRFFVCFTGYCFLSGRIGHGTISAGQAYYWVYIFAASIGFATTLAEPSLLAVAIKAEQISGGAIHAFGLRIAVSIGVAFGIALGAFRIVTGTELYFFIIAGYVLVLIQTLFAPKLIIGLAYDSGGVTTSTVTVPLVTALGLGLAQSVPGRNPLLDGFGLIAFASLFPIIAVLSYAQIAQWRSRRSLSSKP